MRLLKKTLVLVAQLLVVATLLLIGFAFLVRFSVWAHHTYGRCGGPDKCSWPWCEHYQGSSFLRPILSW